MYLILKCERLDDQWECDASRFPAYWCKNYTELKEFVKYMKRVADRDHEIWKLHKDNHDFECLIGLDDLYWVDQFDKKGNQIERYDKESNHLLKKMLEEEEKNNT